MSNGTPTISVLGMWKMNELYYSSKFLWLLNGSRGNLDHINSWDNIFHEANFDIEFHYIKD